MTPKPAPARSFFLLPVATLCARELIRFYRQRSRVIGALGTPLVFWLLIGSGIGTSFHAPADPGNVTYLEYFFPGTLLLIVLFTSIFCMMSTIEDRHQGFLQSVLVAPISRTCLVLGKVTGGTALALVQAFIFLLLAPAVGFHLRPTQVLLLTAVLLGVALGVTALGFSVAWELDSVQGFHGVVNLFLIPMWVLSGALFPSTGAAEWIRWMMKLNPMTYALAALRRTLQGDLLAPDAYLPSLPASLVIVALFAGATLLIAFAIVHRPATHRLG